MGLESQQELLCITIIVAFRSQEDSAVNWSCGSYSRGKVLMASHYWLFL